MTILKRLKGKKSIIFALLVFTLSFNTERISNASSNSLEDMSLLIKDDDYSNEKMPDIIFNDGSYIEIRVEDEKIILSKFDSSKTNISSTEILKKSGYDIEQVLSVENHGFIIVSKNNNILDDLTLLEDNDLFNIFAFNKDGHLVSELNIKEDISIEQLLNFITNSFDISIEDIKSYIKDLSDEDIYDLSLYLVNIAEKTLKESDIINANYIINIISDDEKREELIKKLNLISNQSIDEELDISNDESDLIIENENPNISTISDSYIDLSVHTNNITFDNLNLSQDTIVHDAISLEVSSSLSYDINMYITEAISSNKNNSTLNNDIFSVKESRSSDFVTFDDTGIVNVLQNQPSGDSVTHNLDLKLNTSKYIIKDIYRTAFKIEAITK